MSRYLCFFASLLVILLPRSLTEKTKHIRQKYSKPFSRVHLQLTLKQKSRSNTEVSWRWSNLIQIILFSLPPVFQEGSVQNHYRRKLLKRNKARRKNRYERRLKIKLHSLERGRLRVDLVDVFYLYKGDQWMKIFRIYSSLWYSSGKTTQTRNDANCVVE